MFCKFCGNELADDMKFCPKCGATTAPTDIPSVDELFDAEPYVSYDDEEKNSTSTKSLVLGILSLVFSGLVGFILALVGMKQVKKYAALNDGIINGKARVGKILCSIGIPVSIFSFIYSLVMFFGTLTQILAENGLI